MEKDGGMGGGGVGRGSLIPKATDVSGSQGEGGCWGWWCKTEQEDKRVGRRV